MHSASRLSAARLPSWYGMPASPASGQQMAWRRFSQNADLADVKAVPTSPSRPRKARRMWPSATRFRRQYTQKRSGQRGRIRSSWPLVALTTGAGAGAVRLSAWEQALSIRSLISRHIMLAHGVSPRLQDYYSSGIHLFGAQLGLAESHDGYCRSRQPQLIFKHCITGPKPSVYALPNRPPPYFALLAPLSHLVVPLGPCFARVNLLVVLSPSP
jgi:hypothetical protein